MYSSVPSGGVTHSIAGVKIKFPNLLQFFKERPRNDAVGINEQRLFVSSKGVY
jgi:hypothetical protein